MDAILDLPEMRARVRRWTVEEYEKFGDDPAFRRTELIRGLIVNKMSRLPLHSNATTCFYVFLVRAVRPEFVARQEQPLRLSDSMPEPDISVMRGRLSDFDSRHPSTAELVVEVAVSSVAGDRENASLYAEAKVTQYWIVLGETEQVEVYRRPLDGVYQEKRIYQRTSKLRTSMWWIVRCRYTSSSPKLPVDQNAKPPDGLHHPAAFNQRVSRWAGT